MVAPTFDTLITTSIEPGEDDLSMTTQHSITRTSNCKINWNSDTGHIHIKGLGVNWHLEVKRIKHFEAGLIENASS